MSMFGVFYKKSHFSRVSEIKSLNLALFCVYGKPRLKIRFRDHSWTHFDFTNLMAVSELTNELPLKIMFFEVSSIISIYVKF